MSFRRGERGSAAVETALIFPVLIGIALLATDIYTLHQTRSYLEQSAHTIASVLGVQTALDTNGVQALIDEATRMTSRLNMDQRSLPFELVISKVESDHHMVWRPLYRGQARGICPQRTAGSAFIGDLPQTSLPVQESQSSNVDAPLVVVQLCLQVDQLDLSTSLLAGNSLQVQAVSRLQHGTPTLDNILAQELLPQGQQP